MKNMMLTVAFCLLICAGVVKLHADATKWWDARWDRRCSVTFKSAGAAITAVPVTITGAQLKKLTGGEPFSMASSRVIGPKGEITSQSDEFDGGASVAANPNHQLDDNDELVFQVDIPAPGPAVHWIYWNASPLPPGKYETSLFIGDAMEPAHLHHDIQLWNDRCRLGMRGPARGEDPTKNEIHNWGAGALTLMELNRHAALNINGSWTSIFPLGAVACSPSADGARWERPEAVARGPVRVGARTQLTEATVATGKDANAKVNVEHRVWLYDRGACVLFEESIQARSLVALLEMNFGHPFVLGSDRGDRFWYSEKDALKVFQPTAEQAAEAEKGKVVFSDSGFDPWMAAYSTRLKTGYAVVLDSGASLDGEQRIPNFYWRTHAYFRFNQQWKNLSPGQRTHQRFWVVGFNADQEGRAPLSIYKTLTRPDMALGAVERRDAR